MTSFASGGALFAAFAILIAVLLYARLATAWRVARGDGQLRLVQVLARHGKAIDQALGAGDYQAAIAMRRCAMCAATGKKACDQWLASGTKQGIEAFCPNSEFIARVTPARAA